MNRLARLALVTSLALVLDLALVNRFARAEPSTPLNFTEAQAEHGGSVYAQRCASCHGTSLAGGAGTALNGSTFASRWFGQQVRGLYQVIATQMPLSAPGSLARDDYVDVTAFVLHQNGIAATAQAMDATTLAYAFIETGGAPAGAAVAKRQVPALPAEPLRYAEPSGTGPGDAELSAADAANWLGYNRDLRAQRFSPLQTLNSQNAAHTHAVCAFQSGESGWFEASPIVYDGVLFFTMGDHTYALDAATCKKIWEHEFHDTGPAPTVSVSRGLSIYAGAIYRATPGGHLLALDAKSGELIWDTWLSATEAGYWLSAAPAVFGGRVFMGTAGAENGTTGRMYAFDAASGRRLWTFDMLAGGSGAHGKSWGHGTERGGGATWAGYTIDPQQDLLYVSIGNPAPDYAGEGRPGDNLYTDSVVALDIKTGRLVWYAQQIAHDTHDFDTAAAPVLYDQGNRQYMAVASKDGWLYIYDRRTHALLSKSEVSRQENVDVPLGPTAIHVCPGSIGGVEWNGPAYSPALQMLFVNSVEWCGTYTNTNAAFAAGQLYLGGVMTPDPVSTAHGWLRAFDAASGKQRWQYASPTPMIAGITPTAGNVLLTGDLNGDFLIVDATSGKILYRFNTGGAIAGGVSTYSVGGKQYVAVASGNSSKFVWQTKGAASIFVFGIADAI